MDSLLATNSDIVKDDGCDGSEVSLGDNFSGSFLPPLSIESDFTTAQIEDLPNQRKREHSEDQEIVPTHKKKRKNVRARDFFLDEAEVGDDYDEEEEGSGSKNVDNKPKAKGLVARDYTNHHRETIFDGKNAEEITAYLLQKYKKTDANGDTVEFSENISNDVTQQQLMPETKDPNMWIVKCQNGEEKSTALLLMRKFLAFANTDEPLEIKSVVAPENAKGYIYVEAFKVAHVIKAIDGVGSLKNRNWSISMVPIKEVTDVLKVVSKETKLKPKQWVRVKRGLYKGDLAQVHKVDYAENMATLRLIPRIDYKKLRGALKERNTSEAEITTESVERKNKHRIKRRLFDQHALRAIGGEITKDGDYFIFECNQYSPKGFLYKLFAISSIMAEGIKPLLADVEEFEEGSEEIDIELDVSNQEAPSDLRNFSMGDNVKVSSGDLLGLQGKITGIDDKNITMQPMHEDLKDPLLFKSDELIKHFKAGDHVKVIAGRHEGDTGLIVRVETSNVFLMSDLSLHEIDVLPRDLQICADVATGVDSLGHFFLGDLVQIDEQTVGAIVRLERENFQILTMHDKVISKKPASLQKRNVQRNAVALDCDSCQIRCKDIVKVLQNGHTLRDYKVKHVYRHWVFLYCRLHTENGGIFVCKSRMTKLVSSKAPMNSISFAMMPPPQSPRLPIQINVAENQQEVPQVPRRDTQVVGFSKSREIIGKNVKVTSGPYKGNVGTIKDVLGHLLQLELYSSVLTILVHRTSVQVVNENTALSNFSKHSSRVESSSESTMGIFYGAKRTPNHGESQRVFSQTPQLVSATPSYDFGNRTPFNGAITPTGDNSLMPYNAWDPSSDNVSTPKKPVFKIVAPSKDKSRVSSVTSTVVSKSVQRTPIEISAFLQSQTEFAASISTYNASPSAETPKLQPDWSSQDMIVKISWLATALDGVVGVIQKVVSARRDVFLLKENRTVTLTVDRLRPVVPEVKEHCEIIYGDDRGSRAMVISIFQHEALIKVGERKKFIPLNYLCKMQQNSKKK